jgi:solute carrier family 35 protein F5
MSLLGYYALTVMMVLVISSNVLVQDKVFPTFPKPLFISMIGASMTLLLWIPQWRQGAPIAALLRLAIPVSLIGFLSNTTFNASLMYTSLSMTTIVSATSTVFTWIITMVVMRQPSSLRQLFAATLSFVGCAIVVSDQGLHQSGAESDSGYAHYFGFLLALVSAVATAFYAVIVKSYNVKTPTLFVACCGLVLTMMLPGILRVSDTIGLEPFEWPTTSILILLMANGIGGSLVCSVIYVKTLELLDAVTVNVFLSLSIPLSVVVDALVNKNSEVICFRFIIGAIAVFASVVISATEKDEKPSRSVIVEDYEPEVTTPMSVLNSSIISII